MRSVIVEIRPGVGGAEASLFVTDLAKMYRRYAERVGWAFEVIDTEPLVLRVSDPGKSGIQPSMDISRLNQESGVHCIQRVSPTDSRGRVHTSTATVAVLPEPEPRDVEIRESDLRVEVMRSSGNGGQGMQKISSRVRITHVPTGMTAICSDDRSQHRNRDSAMAVLRARVADAANRNATNATNGERRGQIGGAQRAERMRTYDLPDDVVSDRRLGRKVRGAARVLRGDLSALLA